MKNCLKDKIFTIISQLAADENREAYVIGGYVRDCLLERKTKDIDVVVTGNGVDFAEKLAASLGKVKANYFKNFGTAMIRFKDREIEIVGARKESYRSDSRKPTVEDGSIEDDQNRRDFTINTLAISLNKHNMGELIDPFNGVKDLKEGIIRTPLDPDRTFSDDPLRMLRAVRFASRLNFKIEEDTFRSIRNNRERIAIISQERITDELNKILMSDKPSLGFRLLESAGLLELVFPELANLRGVDSMDGKKHKEVFLHTLQVLDNLSLKSDNIWLRWAALLHDIAKPATKKYQPSLGWTFHSHEFIGARMVPGIFKSLKLPLNDKMKYVEKMVLLHLRPIALAEDTVTDSAVRRLLFEAGDDIDDLMDLCEADITSKNELKVRKYLSNFKLVRKKLKEIEEKDQIRNFQPPVSGDEIQELFGIPPSREVGIIKNAIKEAILEGEIPNEKEAAVDFMMKKAIELGLKPGSTSQNS